MAKPSRAPERRVAKQRGVCVCANAHSPRSVLLAWTKALLRSKRQRPLQGSVGLRGFPSFLRLPGTAQATAGLSGAPGLPFFSSVAGHRSGRGRGQWGAGHSREIQRGVSLMSGEGRLFRARRVSPGHASLCALFPAQHEREESLQRVGITSSANSRNAATPRWNAARSWMTLAAMQMSAGRRHVLL
ncbi:hypothetical protein NDU88_012344 [Pleurodeles waltl]|uniref:Uncharacterized protein n=1 Tax=Pleurodeles waltl TaxID=8319 RepID=A0AAV7R2K3_PLEWA|nr:hypothetical protein NDU88_012344 [Pleurodeles waltl]